jgi:hypothetical protein
MEKHADLNQRNAQEEVCHSWFSLALFSLGKEAKHAERRHRHSAEDEEEEEDFFV